MVRGSDPQSGAAEELPQYTAKYMDEEPQLRGFQELG